MQLIFVLLFSLLFFTIEKHDNKPFLRFPFPTFVDTFWYFSSFSYNIFVQLSGFFDGFLQFATVGCANIMIFEFS